MSKRTRNIGMLLSFLVVFSLATTACESRKRMVSASSQYDPKTEASVSSAGKARGSAVLNEAQVTETLQKVLAGLPGDLIQFYPPPALVQDRKVRMEARMARTLLENLNRALLAKEWKVDALVGARLSGDNFEFHNLGPEDQMVGAQEFTSWAWETIPLATGDQVLKLNMTLRVVTASGAQYRGLPVIERPVNVTPRRTGGVLKFLQDYWAWILGVILVAGIVAILVIEPAKKKS